MPANPFHVGYWAPYHPLDHMTAPTRNRPSWYVPMLVYKGGVPDQSTHSLTGGGFLPQKSLRGRQLPSWQPYVQPLSSQVGGGNVPTQTNFLAGLLGGRNTRSPIP